MKNAQFTGEIHKFGFQAGEELNGERGQEIQQWIENCFKPYLQRHEIQDAVINMTGGTKILSAMLLKSHHWQQIHYQAFSRSENVYIDCFDSQLNFIEEIQLNPPKKNEIIHFLELYADNVKQHSTNPILKNPDSLTLAEMRFQAQNNPDCIESGNLFPIVLPVLEEFWKETHQQPHTIPWSKFQGVSSKDIRAFMQRLIDLHPAQNFESKFTLTDESITLPHNYKNNGLNQWKKWISGEWFEQLIQNWFREKIKIAPHNLQTGLQISRAEGKGNETDILLFHKNQLLFCELKSNADNLSEMRKQVIEQSDGLGKVGRVLILSPIIQKKTKSEKWDNFVKECDSKQIKIILAHNAKSLREIS
ncbi:hypothetical protein QEO94_00505 [Kingella negevensis]|uniref:hypothetical protein n=1 Tax=Kingella negevensis TaxID=1522312 RepID=UPI002542EAE5|nr:hypothetical protein [Kingella negevensis]WII93381.1 hypothetical protein QEO94_00505 [Kingella negevensis]